MINIQNLKLPYYQMEKRDLPSNTGCMHGWMIPHDFIRGARAALPFLALYQPWNRPLALLFGLARTCSNLNTLTFTSYQNGILNREIFLDTVFSAAALAATRFSLPLGIAVTTSIDLLNDAYDFSASCYKTRPWKSQEAFGHGLDFANKALYLSCILTGSLPLVAGSFALQTVVGGYHSYREYNNGKTPEAIAHLGMAIFRGNQGRELYPMISR
jgi:hypothetical protein